jgi:hypothetical protein
MLEMPRKWNICPQKAAGKEWRQPRGEAMWAAISKVIGPGCPSPLEFTSQHYVPWRPDMELQDLMFALSVLLLLSVSSFLAVLQLFSF